MKKRILSLLLALCMCLSLTAYAVEYNRINYPTDFDLYMDARVGNGELTVVWQPLPEVDAAIVSRQLLCYADDPANAMVYEPTEDEQRHVFTGLTNDTEYTIEYIIQYDTGYEIVAKDTATPYSPDSLLAPVITNIALNGDELTIAWDFTGDQSQIDYYELTVSGQLMELTDMIYPDYPNVFNYTTYIMEDQTYTVSVAAAYLDGKISAPVSEIVVSGTGGEPVEEEVWPFVDVPEDHPSYEAIRMVYDAENMVGTSENTFSPDMSLSRAMIARVLYNWVGNPEVEEASNFTDVKRDFWYTTAIDWASAHEIVVGNGKGQFMPNDDVTREQLAVMIYQLIKSTQVYDMSVGEDTNVLSYNDAMNISSWAMSAVQWACGTGVLTDNDGNLRPTEPATRAEVAEAIVAFAEFYAA